MASQDFLLRAKRPASLVAFNGLLPANFKLIANDGDGWYQREGVNLFIATSGGLSAAESGGVIHYNLRVTPAWSGWDGLFLASGDDGYGDPKLDKSKLKRWAKNNGGGEIIDPASGHPRTGRADMNWWRIPLAGSKWMDISIGKPSLQRLTFS